MGDVFTTQYDRQVISQDTETLLEGTLGECFDLDLGLKTTNEFLQCYIEQMVQGVLETIYSRICERDISLEEGLNLSLFHEGYLIRSRRNVFQKQAITCNIIFPNLDYDDTRSILIYEDPVIRI